MEALRRTVGSPGRDQPLVLRKARTRRGIQQLGAEEKKKNYYRIERSYGTFARSFTLPTQVEADKINASMKDGVLEVTVPKKEEAKPKEIEIKVQ
jgi:HSP20 family protein